MINVSVVLFTGKIKTLLYWDTIAQLECTNSSLYYLLYHLWGEMSHSSSVRIVHRKCVKNMKTFQLSSGSLKCFFSFFFFFPNNDYVRSSWHLEATQNKIFTVLISANVFCCSYSLGNINKLKKSSMYNQNEIKCL